MFEKVEKQLEFQVIVDNVMKEASFGLSKDYMAEFFAIETTFDKVQSLQKYTEVLFDYFTHHGAVELLQLLSFKNIFEKANRNYPLDIEEFLQVKHAYQNVQRIHYFYDKHTIAPEHTRVIKELLLPLIENKSLMEAIDRVISEGGAIQDRASKLLFDTRLEIKTNESKIRSTLQEIMQKEKGKMSEQYFTFRNDRYVLPIKEEYRNTFKGILHDESQSGTTVFIEPQAIVTLNNQIQQLRLRERKEVQRILEELSIAVFNHTLELESNIVHLAKIDIYTAKALYSFKHGLSRVETTNDEYIELFDARHPLLPKNQVVGNDIFMKKPYKVLTITGANTGGKSVFLKTIGLQVLMHQVGLYLPVDDHKENKIGVFESIFLDIGDEQSLEQNLSTFSAHITNVRDIYKQMTKKSIVLLDELGSGTDPVQGASLSIAILEAFYETGATIVVTTHYNEVKEFIAQQSYAENAAMSFDFETLRPTYRVRYGSYGQSYAFDIARSLELPERIIKEAEEHAKNQKDDTANLLSIYEQRLSDVEEREERLTSHENMFKERSVQLKQQENDIAGKLERELQKLEAQHKKKTEKDIRKIKEMIQDLQTKESLKHNERADIQNKLNTFTVSKAQQLQQDKGIKTDVYKTGDIVFVKSLQSNAELIELKGKQNWLVKVGSMTMQVKEKDLSLVKKAKNKDKLSNSQKGKVKMNRVSPELDLRGFRVLEGLEALEQYLANAKSSHEFVRIIHGHGTGQMRDGVQKFLKNNKNIKSYRYGGEGEGGVGVTVVEL